MIFGTRTVRIDSIATCVDKWSSELEIARGEKGALCGTARLDIPTAVLFRLLSAPIWVWGMWNLCICVQPAPGWGCTLAAMLGDMCKDILGNTGEI